MNQIEFSDVEPTTAWQGKIWLKPVDVSYTLMRVNVTSSSSLNMRAEPNDSSTIVGKYPNGTLVAVYSIDENLWAKVKVIDDGKEGYMYSTMLAEVTE